MRAARAFCKECGFISNVAFDPSKLNYSSVYEDQQSFSSTFNAFAHDIARRLIEKHNLHNKSILEIGCGKDDFLALLCELDHNRGAGIDPAYVEGRVHGEASDRLTFSARAALWTFFEIRVTEDILYLFLQLFYESGRISTK